MPGTWNLAVEEDEKKARLRVAAAKKRVVESKKLACENPAERLEEIRVERENLAEERKERADKLEYVTRQCDELKAHVAQEEELLRDRVRDARKRYADSSPSGYVDKLLQVSLTPQSLRQSKENITKFTIEESLLRADLQQISVKEAALRREVDDLHADGAWKDAIDALAEWVTAELELDDKFAAAVGKVIAARKRDGNVTARLRRQGIDSEFYILLCDSKLKATIAEAINRHDLVLELSKIYTVRDNLFYRDNSTSSRMPRQETPFDRPQYMTNPMIEEASPETNAAIERVAEIMSEL